MKVKAEHLGLVPLLLRSAAAELSNGMPVPRQHRLTTEPSNWAGTFRTLLTSLMVAKFSKGCCFRAKLTENRRANKWCWYMRSLDFFLLDNAVAYLDVG